MKAGRNGNARLSAGSHWSGTTYQYHLGIARVQYFDGGFGGEHCKDAAVAYARCVCDRSDITLA